MKTLRLVALLLAALAAPALAQSEARRFTPYFNMTLGETLFVQQSGDFFSGGNLKGNVGLLANVTQSGNHAVFGMYQLNYTGPGVQPQDTQEWHYRTMDHIFNVEYRWKVGDTPFRIRPGLLVSRTYTRTGANETWGTGLYDSKSSGGQLNLDYLYTDGAVTASYLQRKVLFPNFTDLLREFQNAGNTAVTSGGLQDQNITQVGLSAYWKKLFAGVTSSEQKYKNQDVVDSNGVYGSTLQKDKTLSANAGFTGKLWRFEVQPSATITKFDSNQNFIRYKFFGATDFTNGDVVFVSDYYSYNAYTFNLPFYFNLTRMGTALNFGYSVTHRVFKDRAPADTNYDYISGKKQTDDLHTLSFGLRKRLNEIAFMHLTYSTMVGTSNMKFEKYLPYNFTATAFGMAFEVVY